MDRPARCSRHNNFPVRLDGQAVLRSGLEIHIYRVERRDGDRLWLEGDDDGPRGWASIDQLVRVEDALAYLADRIRVHPDQAFYHALRAVVLSDKNNLVGAFDEWNKIVELEPDDAASYVGRAKLALARMEWDRAITDLTRAIKIDPEDPYCYRVRAHAWCAKHDYDRAIDDCDQAIKLDRENASALVTRAQARLGQQKYDNAIADATAAVRLDPSAALAYLYRGLAWARKKELDKAIADYDAAIRLDSDQAEYYYNRAWAWQQKGDKARAMADYAVGVGLDPALKYPGREPVPASADANQEEKAVDRFLVHLPLEHVRADLASDAPPAKNGDAGVVTASFDPVPAPQAESRQACAPGRRARRAPRRYCRVTRSGFPSRSPRSNLQRERAIGCAPSCMTRPLPTATKPSLWAVTTPRCAFIAASPGAKKGIRQSDRRLR